MRGKEELLRVESFREIVRLVYFGIEVYSIVLMKGDRLVSENR